MQQGLWEGQARSQVVHSWLSIAAPTSLSPPLTSASRHEAHSSQPTQGIKDVYCNWLQHVYRFPSPSSSHPNFHLKEIWKSTHTPSNYHPIVNVPQTTNCVNLILNYQKNVNVPLITKIPFIKF
jgi:hypothetical protein